MTETLPAIHKTYALALPPDAAFALFTERLVEWWPLGSHSLSAAEGKVPINVALEPRKGGRITETRHDGNSAEWGRITHWDAGRKLGVDWYVGRDPAQATHFDLSFVATTDGGSRLDLVHAGFERLGPGGAAAAANYDDGWDIVLGEGFAGACAEAAPA